ncbi:RHS repeat-associated core domain-containing protein [Bernardetia sp. OM2101]|uniref:RHS repeat domain-containing protein n=1 Tax=Bernardetia sp. OM2101 TaxID=3344876 RepID=UPI0035CEF1C7
MERTEATVAVVVQENHYYPFGMNMKGIEELDLQSLGNTDEHRFQYNGKEKEESFGLYWTDYGWRNMDTQLGRWHGIDGMAEKYISQSTYHYAGNNPVSNLDIDGNEFTDALRNLVDKVISELDSRIKHKENRVSKKENSINNTKGKLATAEAGSRREKRLERKLARQNNSLSRRKEKLNDVVSTSQEIISEFNTLEASSQVYDFKQNNSLDNKGLTGFDLNTGTVVIELTSSASVGLIAHELKHAYQFETGSFSVGREISHISSYFNLLYDRHDEVEAYERQAIFGGSAYGLHNLPSPTYDFLATGPYSYKNIPEIQSAINSSNPQKELQRIARVFKHAFRVNGTTIILNKYIMKKKFFYYYILIILVCFSCTRMRTDRYYSDLCLLYGEPSLYLKIFKNGNFTYRFIYAPKKISGKWKVHKDTLILESPLFLLEKEEDIMQMVKNTSVHGRDAYIIKGKKLYALDSNNNLVTKCPLKLSKKSKVNLEHY